MLGQCTGGAPQNLAVYEGTQNISMMCNSPTTVSWTVRSTTAETNAYRITNYNDIVVPAYADLYGVNSFGLIIKIAQGNATIPPISTAGLYVIQINAYSTQFGAKLTVVRKLMY